MKVVSFVGAVVIALSVVTVSARADTLYAGTGSNGIAGSLYTIDPANGTSTLVGPLMIGSDPIGVTGLAFQPSTGILYGVTANSTRNGATNPRSLVTIDPATGQATLVGQLALDNVGDIAFATDGTLYGWEAHSPYSLVTIDPVTAAESQIGTSGLSDGTGDSLSFVGGTLYVSAETDVDGSPLRTVDLGTGVATTVATLTGAPQQTSTEGSGAIAALATSSGGVLFGVDNNREAVALTSLVTIDTSTGVVSTRGDLPDNTDALAFQFSNPVPAVSNLGLLALFAALGIFGVLVLRQRP